jgi:hypothetical protein
LNGHIRENAQDLPRAERGYFFCHCHAKRRRSARCFAQPTTMPEHEPALGNHDMDRLQALGVNGAEGNMLLRRLKLYFDDR